MSGEQFLEKYQNRNWIFLMDNPDVRRYVLSYPNEKTRQSIAQTIYDFMRELNKTEPDFNINNLLEMDGIAAREKIWQVIMSYIEREKYRTAGLLKVYLKLFYDYVHELRRDNQIVSWKRRHQVPKIKTKKSEVPNHEQIYRLIDKTTHLRIQTIILLSYSSGLKGAGIINLRVGDLREAINFRDRLKEEFINEKNRTTDPKAQKDLDELISNLPLIIKITSEIYFKRFRNGSTEDWYPALVCHDSEKLLLKYYKRKRKDASDSEPLFVTGIGRKLTQVELSKSLGYNIKKFFEATGELKNTSPSLLRRAFYNRLIAGNMKDIHREFLMGHALGVKGHYFDWESNKKEILLSYIRCNYNRMANDVIREITSLKEDSMSKDEKIKRLEKELEYFKSPAFTKDIIQEIKVNGFQLSEPKKVITKVIDIGDKESWQRLSAEGYYLVASDDEHFILEKEVEE